MFWKKDNVGKKLKQMNEILKKSFANVKRDTANIFQWLNYFYKKNIEQEQRIKQIGDYYSLQLQGIITKIKELNEKIDELARKQSTQTHIDISHIEKRLEKLEQKKQSAREKIMKKITRNSKEYVKSIILSYIKKYEKISALQLKEIIVDEQNFCSKSSFYRILDEIDELEDIGVVRHGKEKHYISKAKAYIGK